MQLDLTLNVIWVMLGVLAIVLTLGVSTRRPRSKRWQFAGILLVVAALFPFISATDDVLRVEHYTSQRDGHHSPRTTTGDDLIRLYEAMDAPLAPHVTSIAFVLLFFSFVTVTAKAVLNSVTPSEFGRSPPAFFSAAS